MNFCSNCGTRVVLKVPEDDLLPRHVCENSEPQYENPKLCRQVPDTRVHPALNAVGLAWQWTIRGFMETDETSRPARARGARRSLYRRRDGSRCSRQRTTRVRYTFFARSALRIRSHTREPRSGAGRRTGHPARTGVSSTNSRCAVRGRPQTGVKRTMWREQRRSVLGRLGPRKSG